ncbi:uncharacterized protein LOC110117124 [Athalia rosae]|uniref:uncharacterized protein LOC110117124 n=1 Tax=Athalia rosae TaxID=37344 RepID=UPI002033B7C9|nr:uncharacterized protein LOC110117124 [Athalia rosae]
MLAVRQAWSLVYFLLILLLSISYTVVGIAVLEESIYDDFPVMIRYRSYIRVILCILGFLIGVSDNLLTGSSSYNDDITLQFGHWLTIVLVFVLTFSIGYVYGTQRFSDDINFLNVSQPATFWKICWKSCPFGILILIGKEIIAIKFSLKNVAEITSSIAYALVLTMAVFRLLHLIVMSIKARNVTGMLFQATPQWGPPDQEDRRIRNTYNPREETRYWRRNNLCTHRCLINNKLIKTIVAQEVASRVRTQDKDVLHKDFSKVMAQSKQNQAIFAIEKVSSTELEAFEEEVEQKIKFLEKTREIAAKLRSQSISPKNQMKAIESTDALDQRIEEIVRQAEQKAQLENRNDKKTEQKTFSKTRHKQMPTFVPKDTPRPRKQVLKTRLPVERKSIGEKQLANIHTYTVQIPDFNLNPLKRAHPQSAFMKSTPRLEVVKMLKEPNQNTAPVLNKLHVIAPVLSLLAGSSKSTPTSLSQRKFAGVGPKPVESHFPPKMPLNSSLLSVLTPELGSSATSSSTLTKEAGSSCCQIQNIRETEKTNMTFESLPLQIPSISESLESFLDCSELHLLNHDLVLRDIIYSVHPQLISNEVTPACHEMP